MLYIFLKSILAACMYSIIKSIFIYIRKKEVRKIDVIDIFLLPLFFIVIFTILLK